MTTTVTEKNPDEVSPDVGCELHNSCLTCPYPVCKEEVPGGARGLLGMMRNHDIVLLFCEAEMDVNDIADTFGMSRRSVFRVLEQHKLDDRMTLPVIRVA